MPPQVMPPEPLARAQERGLCRYLHLSLQVTVPPATGGTPVVYLNLPDEELTGIVYEMPAINIFRIMVAPPIKDYIWRTFSLAWGEMSPAGISLDVVITHGQFGMVLHDDPWIHSLVDYTYPHSLTLMKGRPELLIIENKTAVEQTLDVTIHMMSFHSKEDWDAYETMLVEWDKMLAEDIRRAELQIAMLEELRKIYEAVKAMPSRRLDPLR